MSNEVNASKTVSSKVFRQAILQAYKEQNSTISRVTEIIAEMTGVWVPYASFGVKKNHCKKEDLTAIADAMKSKIEGTEEHSTERSAILADARKAAQKVEILYSMKRAKSERKADGSHLSILDLMDEMENDEASDEASDE